MAWDKKKQAKWVEKRRKEYGMVCLKKQVIKQLQKMRITKRETYSEIIQRLIGTHNVHQYEEEFKKKFFDPENKE